MISIAGVDLELFERGQGAPILYLYLFGVWVAGICAVFVLARTRWEGET